MGQRLKGQEVELVLLQDGAPQDTLAFAQSMEMTFKTETLQEGYLGETTDRYDTIYKGISGKVKYHYDNPAFLRITLDIINKARRRTPGTRFNFKATMNFPGGQRARIVIRDIEFGPLPIGFGSRSDYGTYDLDFSASDAQVLPL